MASSSQPNRVYLSFEEDVRSNIFSHLNSKLECRGLPRFVTSEQQRQVKRISKELTQAIEESSVAVILFSKNFASSALCLDEVVKIIDCRKTSSLSVLPVFYKVDPREIREPRYKYEKAFKKHKESAENSKDVKKWKEALYAAGSLSGWDYNVGADEESEKGTTIQSGNREFKADEESEKGTTIRSGNREFEADEESEKGTTIQSGNKEFKADEESEKGTTIRSGNREFEADEESEKGTTIRSGNREFKADVKSEKGTTIRSGNREFKDEAELVKSIVEEITIQLRRIPLDFAMHPIGIDSRVKDLTSLLNMESRQKALDKCNIIGLWSMGGMGKTILAKAIYNSIFRKFEGSAFLEDINKTLKNSAYVESLQEKLLCQILTTEEKVTGPSAGIKLIKDKLHRKRVLIILDGVDSICQIEDLAGRDWFGGGSKIIITTRNQGVLKQLGARVYEVRALKRIDAIKLFKNYVFGDGSQSIKECPAEKALKHTQGLPFALKELGFAFNVRSDWECILDEFARSSCENININLRKSYEELDNTKKDIFLNIACFFDGWSRVYVEGVLGSCYQCHRLAEKVDDLIQRSLIRDENGTLRVHVLIELMAKDIVDQDCRVNPTTRSRIWCHGQLADVLSRDEGRNAAVQAIVLDEKDVEEIDIGPDGFANLKMLRFLILINVDTNFQGATCLPNGLRWFEWQQHRASGVKFTSTPKKLAVLAVRKAFLKNRGNHGLRQ